MPWETEIKTDSSGIVNFHAFEADSPESKYLVVMLER